MSGDRTRARQIVKEHLDKGDPTGWFEALYSEAGGDHKIIPWVDLQVNPHLVEWAERSGFAFAGKKAIVVGCGLGDDAEGLARWGCRVTAFDIAPSAIEWCQRRFPDSTVDYQAANALDLPPAWKGAFDLVLEAYTLQTLPPELRGPARQGIAGLVAPGGTLLVLARRSNPGEKVGTAPWHFTRAEVDGFGDFGLKQISFEEYLDTEDPPVPRFRAVYRW